MKLADDLNILSGVTLDFGTSSGRGQISNPVIKPDTLTPSNPDKGQLWFDDNVGQRQLKFYDGSSWLSTGGIADAPADGLTYGRKNNSWVSISSLSGYLKDTGTQTINSPTFSSSPGGIFRLEVRSDTTFSRENVLRLSHNVDNASSTSGLSVGLLFEGQTSTTENREIGAVFAEWVDANDTTRTGKLTFSIVDSGSSVDAFGVDDSYFYVYDPTGSASVLKVERIYNVDNPITIEAGRIMLPPVTDPSNNVMSGSRSLRFQAKTRDSGGTLYTTQAFLYLTPDNTTNSNYRVALETYNSAGGLSSALYFDQDGELSLSGEGGSIRTIYADDLTSSDVSLNLRVKGSGKLTYIFSSYTGFEFIRNNVLIYDISGGTTLSKRSSTATTLSYESQTTDKIFYIGVGVNNALAIQTTDTNGDDIEIHPRATATNQRLIVYGNGTGGLVLAQAADRLGFFGATPITKQTTTSQTPATFTANTSGISDDSATWDGYTIGDIVAILKAYGLLT